MSPLAEFMSLSASLIAESKRNLNESRHGRFHSSLG